MSKTLEKDDLLKFICEMHKECITGVDLECKNLKVTRTDVSFDITTVIQVEGDKRYAVASVKEHWPRGKGNTLTISTPCPFKPLTIS